MTAGDVRPRGGPDTPSAPRGSARVLRFLSVYGLVLLLVVEIIVFSLLLPNTFRAL